MRRSTPPPVPRRRSRQYSNPDVFSDEHALDTFDVPSDHSTTDIGAIDSSERQLRTRTLPSAERASQADPSLLHRSNNSHWHERSVGIIHREPSDASTSFIPRAQSPYRGATGPIHPYAMYNQDQGTGVSRSSSNATKVAARTPLQTYSGPSGPTHPYGLYAQNTVSEEDFSSGSGATQHMPVANTGPSQAYQRRQGPGGEEADDLIGPDGHTEQLPPYTQYPNDLPPKERLATPAQVTGTGEGVLPDPHNTSNSGPMENGSNSNFAAYAVNSPTSPDRTSTSRLVPERAAAVLSDPAQIRQGPVEDEGGNFKEVSRSQSKKRTCGIVPLWLLVLIVGILVVIVVIGATVGSIRHKRWEHEIAAARSSKSPT